MPLCESHGTAEVGENEKLRGFTAGLLECGVKVAPGSVPALFMEHISLGCALSVFLGNAGPNGSWVRLPVLRIIE